MHLAPTASRRVYQQRIGRIMRMHPRKEAGIVVDFVAKGSTHNDRVVSLHALLNADFYREGARVTPAPRRRQQRRARRKLSPVPWLVPVTPTSVAGLPSSSASGNGSTRSTSTTTSSGSGRPSRAGRSGSTREQSSPASSPKDARQGRARAVPRDLRGREPEPPPAHDRAARPRRDPVDRADFDDLVTLVTQAPTWEKDRSAGVRVLLRAIGEEKPVAPDQILARWTWRLARSTRKVQDRRVSTEFPEAKRLLGAAANSRGYRHEENVNRLVQVAAAMPLPVGAALLASADGYTPRANAALDRAREELGTIGEIANALADNLPAPKLTARKSRRRRRKRKSPAQVDATTVEAPSEDGASAEPIALVAEPTAAPPLDETSEDAA